MILSHANVTCKAENEVIASDRRVHCSVEHKAGVHCA